MGYIINISVKNTLFLFRNYLPSSRPFQSIADKAVLIYVS